MRVYLAFAVLMLALIAYTEAADGTLEEQATALGNKVADTFRSWGQTIAATFEDIKQSEKVQKAKAWAQETFGGTN